MVNSNAQRRSRKRKSDLPKKPHPKFPLTPHASGKWMKRIKGKLYYFGTWSHIVKGKRVRVEGDGAKEARAAYELVANDLHAGREPSKPGDPKALTVGDLCNIFYTSKVRRFESGEISKRMLTEYTLTTDRLVSAFGKNRRVDEITPADFEALRNQLAKQYGPVRLGNEITKVKTVFKYATDEGLISKTVPFGQSFKKPSASVLRRHKAQNGDKFLTPDECRKLIDAAPVPLKAMLLLGLNGGFGNHDLATLPLSAVDIVGGWVDYPRPKTGIARRCPLWPETVTALREAIAQRPDVKQDGAEGLVFITARGRQWLSNGIAHPVAAAVITLMKSVGVHRKGIGPYTMRHCFRTAADASRDPVAIDLIMGHSDGSMGANYRHGIDDARLQAVVSVVHSWLWPAPALRVVSDVEGGAA